MDTIYWAVILVVIILFVRYYRRPLVGAAIVGNQVIEGTTILPSGILKSSSGFSVPKATLLPNSTVSITGQVYVNGVIQPGIYLVSDKNLNQTSL